MCIRDSHKTTQVRSAACAADQDIRLHADLLERRFRLEADDGLVQQHLIEHGAEYIAVALVRSSHFYGLRNRTAERTAGGRIVCQNSAACLGRIGRRRRYIRVKGLHDGLACV